MIEFTYFGASFPLDFEMFKFEARRMWTRGHWRSRAWKYRQPDSAVLMKSGDMNNSFDRETSPRRGAVVSHVIPSPVAQNAPRIFTSGTRPESTDNSHSKIGTILRHSFQFSRMAVVFMYIAFLTPPIVPILLLSEQNSGSLDFPWFHLLRSVMVLMHGNRLDVWIGRYFLKTLLSRVSNRIWSRRCNIICRQEE
jgi:hypothetical protein